MKNNIDLKACRLQGEIFEKSIIYINSGSATFIRNFMHSNIAKHIDKGFIMQESISLEKIYEDYIKEYGRGHGPLNVSGAIQHSCNYFFYETAKRMGIDTLAKYARYFGLGTKTGIELSGEQTGLLACKKC